MTRFLTSFLRIGAAMIVLVGLSAGTAMGQTSFFDPSQAGTGGTGTQADPYLAGEFNAALSAAQGGELRVLNTGALNNQQSGVSQYQLSAGSGNVRLTGDGEVTLTLDLDLNLNNNRLILGRGGSPGSGNGVNVEFPGNDISLLADGPNAPGGISVVSTNSSATANRIVFTGEGSIEELNSAGGEQISIERLEVNGPVTFVDNNSPGASPDRLKIRSTATPFDEGFLSVSGELDLGGNYLDYGDPQPTTAVPIDINEDGNDLSLSGTITNGQRFTPVLTSGASSAPREFTIDGQGDLAVPVTYLTNDASGNLNEIDRVVFEQTGIGQFGFSNFGTSSAGANEVDFPFLENVRASIQVDGANGANVDFGDPDDEFSGSATSLSVEGTARFLNGADVEAGPGLSFTANDDVEVDGSTTVATFGSDATFNGDFTISNDATANFEFLTTFEGTTRIQGSNTAMNFEEPGGGARGTSNVNGAFEGSDGTVTLSDETAGSTDEGLHNLALNGDVTIETAASATTFDLEDDTDVDRPRLLFAGESGGQTLTINEPGFDVDRVVVQNGVEIAETAPAAPEEALTVNQLLRLEDGVFNTNGFLDATDIDLFRVRGDDGNGELFRGNSDLAYTSDTAVPDRIEYQGTRNISTGDELLPAGLDASVREIPELAVNMENIDAVVTLGVNYTVTSSAEILAGNLSLGSATLSLFNQSTFVRGDGELDPGPVSPEDALIFPDTPDELGVGSEFDIGTDGIDLEYVNEEGPVTTGIEFPTNDRDPDLIRNLTVESGAPVNLRDGSTYRVNQNIAVNDGTLDLNGQTLEANAVYTATTSLDVDKNNDADGSLTGEGESLLRFVGLGQTDVTADTDDENGSVFAFPAVEVNRPFDSDNDDANRRVDFTIDDNNASPTPDPADGFSFNGNFVMSAANDYDPPSQQGIDDGVNVLSEVDIFSVVGDFEQMGGSFENSAAGAEFSVAGSLTKMSADTSRFRVDDSYDVFTVGSESDSLAQKDNGAFRVEVDEEFSVTGNLINESDSSDAFTVGDNGGTEVSLLVTGDVYQRAGNLDVQEFSSDGSSVTVEGNFLQTGGTTGITDARTLNVDGDLTVDLGSFTGPLGNNPSSISNTIDVGGNFTVGTGGEASSSSLAKSEHITADFAVSDGGSGNSTQPAAKDAPVANDRMFVGGDTDIRTDGRFALGGYELVQSGNFRFVGVGDVYAANDTDNATENNGLQGMVRFARDTSGDPQTVTTSESPATYFNSLAVDGAGIQLQSNVTINTADVSVSEGISRDFGTLFLERGDVETGPDTLNVLKPTPTTGGDLAQAINADESSPVGSPDQSPVIGGTRNSHIVGTLRRAVEQQSSTGGFVTDGYIYPLGTGDRYQAAVVEPPTDLGATDFVTVTITDQPDAELTPFETPAINPTTSEEFTLDVNQLSGPFWNVNFDEEPDEDLNVRAIASDLDSRASINDIKQMRIVQLNESESSWQLAGIYDFTSDANDDDDDAPGGPNSFISGVPNIIHEGVDFREGTVISLASDRNINPLDEGQVSGAEIAGTVTYPTVSDGSLADGRALEGATVEVSSSDTTATATTDADGDYAIGGLPAGDYDVELTVSDPVENVQTADALRAVRGFAGIDAFAGPFQEQVADVNGSGNVNATDALLIAQFVLGNVDGFDTGAFVTESESVTVQDGDSGTADLFAAEAGDVRLNGGETGSSEAALASSTISPKTSTGAVATQSSSQSSSVDAEAGKTFEVPVRIDRSTTVGAYQMAFDFPSEKASFEGIKGTAQDVLTNASDGTVKVSWFDQSGESALDLQSGSELVTLRFKAADDVDGVEFAPEVTSGEIAGADATPLSAGVEIQAVRIGAPAPDEFALNGSYPNPVRSQATLNMDLPSRTDVTVEVYNVLGQRVQTMERTMSAGAGQTIKLDGSKFASGQYFYRVKANFEGETAQETGRITVVK